MNLSVCGDPNKRRVEELESEIAKANAKIAALEKRLQDEAFIRVKEYAEHYGGENG